MGPIKPSPDGASEKPWRGHVPNGDLAAELELRHRYRVIVYAVVDDALSPDSPLGDSPGVFGRREDAERFVAEVRNDDPKLAEELLIEERELEAAGGTSI